VFRRVFLALLAAALVAPMGLTVLVAGRTRPRLVEEAERRLASEIALLKALVRTYPEPRALQAALAEAAGSGETRFTLIGSDGKVLADSHAPPEGMDSHGDRPEVREAREREEAPT